jgi:hypothetical protein
MAEYDLNGWTAPDLINPEELSFHKGNRNKSKQ